MQRARHALDVPSDGVVLVTVGAFFKYLPVGQLDFVEVYEKILERLPSAYLLAAGFSEDTRWRKASMRVDGRIRVLGVLSKTQVELLLDAADVYVEGFPFGTTTALLEAGIKGIPVVLAPAQCPPPFGSDGVALDYVVQRSHTLNEYVANVIDLCNDSAKRLEDGTRISRSIKRHHTGEGWAKYLASAIDALPTQHKVSTLLVVPTPQVLHEHWSALVEASPVGYEGVLEEALSNALSLGLIPKIPAELRASLVRFRGCGIKRGVPIGILVLFIEYIAPVLPLTMAQRAWSVLSFLFRPQLVSRAAARVQRLIGHAHLPRSWYSEYSSNK
jgi:hypothetical protein